MNTKYVEHGLVEAIFPCNNGQAEECPCLSFLNWAFKESPKQFLSRVSASRGVTPHCSLLSFQKKVSWEKSPENISYKSKH